MAGIFNWHCKFMDSNGCTKMNNKLLTERTGIVHLVFVGHCAPTAEKCPFREIRKKTWGDKIHWIQQLTDIQIQNMLAFHETCQFNKEHKSTLL